jgi:hypothetical protein
MQFRIPSDWSSRSPRAPAAVADIRSTSTPASTSSGASVAGGAPSGSESSGSSVGGAVQILISGSPRQALELSACMRANDVAEFPDPHAEATVELQPGEGLDPRSPAFQRARRKCAPYIRGANTGSLTSRTQAGERVLAYAKCTRARGVPEFPDPEAGGGGTVRIRFGAAPGLDPDSPIYKNAQQTCGTLLQGRSARKAGP